MASTSLTCFASSHVLILSVFLSVHFQVTEAQGTQPIVKGLSWNFYESICSNVESIIRRRLQDVFRQDIGQAAGLLRLHFHDCFVQMVQQVDQSEKDAPPNLTLRQEAFRIIEDLRRRVHRDCGRVVSCADITAIAACDFVFLSGGPDYDLPLGRRDGLNFATRNETLANLPPPSFNASLILSSLATKNFTPTDVVALSGGHTIGISHCTSFVDRLYPNQDPSMDKTFANNLKITCPTKNTTNTTVLDILSPNKFDNKYYVDLMNRQGLFTSDQDLYTDRRTRGIVTSFAINESLFLRNL
ncbi:peroxidase 12 [Capsicum annuum]